MGQDIPQDENLEIIVEMNTWGRLNEYIRVYEEIFQDKEVGRARQLECMEILRVLYFIRDGSNSAYVEFVHNYLGV